jgi:ABC-type proline/glycine betaine transport system ATPase subunit
MAILQQIGKMPSAVISYNLAVILPLAQRRVLHEQQLRKRPAPLQHIVKMPSAFLMRQRPCSC